jgi:hypothetical protein
MIPNPSFYGSTIRGAIDTLEGSVLAEGILVRLLVDTTASSIGDTVTVTTSIRPFPGLGLEIPTQAIDANNNVIDLETASGIITIPRPPEPSLAAMFGSIILVMTRSHSWRGVRRP